MKHHGSSPSLSSRLKKTKTTVEAAALLLDSEEKSKLKPEKTVIVADDSLLVEEPKKPHILVIDNDPRARFDLEFAFLTHDCDVTTAETCEEALRLLRIDHDRVINSNNQETIPLVDLIIVDYFMVGVPGMTGYMMLPILKKSPVKEIPVMVLAPQAGPQPQHCSQYLKCKEDGADFFMTKPLSLKGVHKFKSAMLKNMGSKKYCMRSHPMNSNRALALAIANDQYALDNHFHGDQDMQLMPNQFYD